MSMRLDDSVILVTGAAGFIGSYVCKRFLTDGYGVVGVDNLNDYYDVGLKQARLKVLLEGNLDNVVGDITDDAFISQLFESRRPKIVVHLAAQAGVRYSFANPGAYIQSNIVGFANILEACRNTGVEHLLYASSSSVYGGNSKVPFHEDDRVDRPASIYAATKKSNELMAHCYSSLFGVRTTGLRLFTVYGPYGRPDMAYFDFADRYFSRRPVNIFKDAATSKDLRRDFTYIDDVVESISRLTERRVAESPGGEVFNVGGSRPQDLSVFVETLEHALSVSLGRDVAFDKSYVGNQPGDVPVTFAATDRLEQAIGFRPTVELGEGLQQFADWYVDYYGHATVDSGHQSITTA